MKIRYKRFVIIALVAIIGFSTAACDDGNGPAGGLDPALNGIWVSVGETPEIELTLNNGSWETKLGGILAMRGTYTTSGNTITETITAYHGNFLTSQSNIGATFDPTWHSRADLKSLGNTDALLDQIFYTDTGTYTVNSTTLTVTDSDGDATTYTRKSGGNGGNGPASSFKAVAGGEDHSAAIATDGSIWTWGRNASGKLGNGTDSVFTTRTTPTKIGPAADWSSIAVGRSHTLAIKTDGSLWAWGNNDLGRLGDGTATDRHAPVRIGSDTNWKSVSAGSEHSLAIKTDGSLWAWGNNILGQLGNGEWGELSPFYTGVRSPVRIGTENNWASVSAGHDHSLAIKTDGSLWSWGHNEYGRLGHGESSGAYGKNTPTRIGLDNNWASVYGGNFHSLAIKTDGSLWAWGHGQNGMLGDGTTTMRTTPVRIGSDTNWKSIFAGNNASFAIKTDGSLWAWGSNSSGKLGDGTTIDRHSPVRIGVETTWASVSGGWYHSLAVKTDGSLWAWGWSEFGRLGDGTTTDRHSPVRIGQ